MGINTPAREPEDIYAWSQRTASDILSKMEYLGHIVNFKTQKKSYKSKKKVNNDPSEWVIFENTHEAIIDQETFEIVQNIRNGRRRLTPMGEMPVLSGMLFCADCGAKLYQVEPEGGRTNRSILYAPPTASRKANAPLTRYAMSKWSGSC